MKSGLWVLNSVLFQVSGEADYLICHWTGFVIKGLVLFRNSGKRLKRPGRVTIQLVSPAGPLNVTFS
ncbi:hypothetical protein DSLASN_20540 [Desulfoluna limicola]|uniref:Uncharacterized protein n=1 Tax=Desulfoluna limicola TaxID=2810562 RepID=A0ABM7PGF6_9BACT|nr:hypothetical protein DSLASN_20540 [Desulfoluna limicola]